MPNDRNDEQSRQQSGGMGERRQKQQEGSGNFANDRERASEAGRKGGQASPGNFKNDPDRASEAGRKGGQR